jgi:hypothetical protein
MLIDPKVIEECLQALIGVNATLFSRAANMLTFGFGPYVEWKTHKGELRSSPTYALHVSCVWRILAPDRIVVGYRDFYHPPRKLTNEEYDHWDWDEHGNNMFDVKCIELNQLFKMESIKVVKISADKYAGFSLYLDNGFELQVIPDHSQASVFWIFLDNTIGDGGYYEFFDPDSIKTTFTE